MPSTQSSSSPSHTFSNNPTINNRTVTLYPNVNHNFSGNFTVSSAFANITSQNEKLSQGAIAGIVIGITTVTFVTGIIFYFIILPFLCIAGPNDPSRRWEISSNNEDSQNENTDEIPPEVENNGFLERNGEGIVAEKDVIISI